MSAKESQPRQELILPAQIGEKSYGLIQHTITQLKKTPQFREAVINEVFASNTASLIDRFPFRIQDYHYVVSYESRNLLPSRKYKDISLSIEKRDPSNVNSMAKVSLASSYEKTGDAIRFIGGDIKVKILSEEYAAGVFDQKRDYRVFEKAENVLIDFLPSLREVLKPNHLP